MRQKYDSSCSLDAENLMLRRSEASVLQPAYGSPNASTTASGADTTFMSGQCLNAVACTVRVVVAAVVLNQHLVLKGGGDASNREARTAVAPSRQHVPSILL